MRESKFDFSNAFLGNSNEPRWIVLVILSVILLQACSEVKHVNPTPEARSATLADFSFTPSAFPTETLIRTPTASASKTPYPVSTPTRIMFTEPTSTMEQSIPLIYDDHLVVAALADSAQGRIILFNPDGKPVKLIQLNHTPLSLTWGSEDCELLVEMTTGEDIRLKGIDLSGEVVQEYFVGGRRDETEWLTWPSLSPTKQWIAYVVWSGEFYYSGAEFQDIEVVPVNGGGVPIRLTQRGGAWESGASWSLDGRYLAYSDYDDHGVNQLYYSTFDGTEKHQLTQFTEPEDRVGRIEWSRDGQTIAFGVYRNYRTEEMRSELWIAPLGGTSRWINFSSEVHYVSPGAIRWSADDNSLTMPAWGPQTLMGLYRIDTISGAVLAELSDFMTRHEYEEFQFDYLNFPIPIGDGQVYWLFSGDEKLYQFDWGSGSVTLLSDPEILSKALIQDFEPFPRGILDVEAWT